eukprot:757180-Hanusia_phi.AAC.3
MSAVTSRKTRVEHEEEEDDEARISCRFFHLISANPACFKSAWSFDFTEALSNMSCHLCINIPPSLLLLSISSLKSPSSASPFPSSSSTHLTAACSSSAVFFAADISKGFPPISSLTSAFRHELCPSCSPCRLPVATANNLSPSSIMLLGSLSTPPLPPARRRGRPSTGSGQVLASECRLRSESFPLAERAPILVCGWARQAQRRTKRRMKMSLLILVRLCNNFLAQAPSPATRSI